MQLEWLEDDRRPFHFVIRIPMYLCPSLKLACSSCPIGGSCASWLAMEGVFLWHHVVTRTPKSPFPELKNVLLPKLISS